MDLGAGRRGVDMGPFSVRVAGIDEKIAKLGYEVEDSGNITVKIQEQMETGDAKQRFLPQIFKVCEELSRTVEKACDNGEIPVVIGGDHSIAMGSLAGFAASYRKKEQKVGLIWFDAHGDFNTPETTTSGNIHGMPLAISMGYGNPDLTSICGFSPKFDPKNVVLIGARDVEAKEAELLKKSGIHIYTMRNIDEKGMVTVMNEAIEKASAGTIGFAASIDMDGFDPDWSSGVGTPVLGGISYREAHLAMEMMADSEKLLHIDLVEINPLLDTANHTSVMGVELVASALGKRIL